MFPGCVADSAAVLGVRVSGVRGVEVTEACEARTDLCVTVAPVFGVFARVRQRVV